MPKTKKNQTHWWIWVQFVFLLISVTTNVLLWFNKSKLDESIRLATYNDSAWDAVAIFDQRMAELSADQIPKVRDLLSNDPLGGTWKRRVTELDAEWLSSARRYTTELKTKLASYQAVVDNELPAVPFADSRLRSLRPPSANAIIAIQARREELRYITFEAKSEVKSPQIGFGFVSGGGVNATVTVDRSKALDALITSLKQTSEETRGNVLAIWNQTAR